MFLRSLAAFYHLAQEEYGVPLEQVNSRPHAVSLFGAGIISNDATNHHCYALP
jgi:hypothetical protein